MNGTRLFAAAAGLTAGFGVLLVAGEFGGGEVAMGDVADAEVAVSAVVTDSPADATSTTFLPTMPATVTVVPTSTRAATTTTSTPATTTTIPWAVSSPPAPGFVMFSPACVGLELGWGSTVSASPTDERLLDVVRDVVAERIVDGDLDDIEDPAEIRADMDEVIARLDLAGCNSVARQSADDSREWLCLFASEVESSHSLARWLGDHAAGCPGVPSGPIEPSTGTDRD